MGQTLTTWTSRVRQMLGGPSISMISDADIQDAIRAAVRRFSADRPRIQYSDYAGDGTTYSLTIPAAWVSGFSAVEAIEYPQGNREPSYLDPAEVSLYPRDSAPTHFRLALTTPASGKTARVLFSVPWPVPAATASDDKVADTDYEPVAHLGAATAALQLAGRAASNKKATIASADAVDWASEETRWRDIARDHAKDYLEHVGGADGVAPASGTVDWDAISTFLETGRHFLFRGRR